jgi:hypothetical protein
MATLSDDDSVTAAKPQRKTTAQMIEPSGGAVLSDDDDVGPQQESGAWKRGSDCGKHLSREVPADIQAQVLIANCHRRVEALKSDLRQGLLEDLKSCRAVRHNIRGERRCRQSPVTQIVALLFGLSVKTVAGVLHRLRQADPVRPHIRGNPVPPAPRIVYRPAPGKLPGPKIERLSMPPEGLRLLAGMHFMLVLQAS